MSLPITGAGVGDTLVISTAHSVENAAWTIAPDGTHSQAFGSVRVYDTAYNGGAVDLPFTDAYTPPTPYAALYFGTSDTQFTLHRGALDTLFGSGEIRNLAFGVFVPSVYWSRFGAHRVYDAAYNGASVDFYFVDSYEPTTAQNVSFLFGTGNLPVTRVGGFASSRVSVPLIYRNYFEVTLSGWLSTRLTTPRIFDPIYNGAAVDFYFVDAYTPEPLYLNLYFGVSNTQVLHQRNPSDAEFGVTTVANTAQGVRIAGLYEGKFGTLRVYDSDANGASVDFNFVAAYTQPSSLNVAFYFVVPHGGVYVRAINFTPLPQPTVTHWIQGASPLAWTYHLFGTPTVYTLTQYVFPHSTDFSSRFGTPVWGNSTHELLAWGRVSHEMGDDHLVELRARLLTGVSAGLQAEFGTQYVAGYYQQIKHVGAFQSEYFGTQTLDWYTRTVTVGPSPDPPSVMPPLVGRHVELSLEGFEDSAFGTFIAYNGTPMWPSGWKSSVPPPSTTNVWLWRRYVPTQSIGSISSIDHATIYNLIQHVTHINGYDELDWAEYGEPLVENFIKELKPQGWRSDRFAFYPADLVQPYQVIPATIEPPAFERQMISHWLRYIPVESIDSYVEGRWMVVYSTAREVYPVGIPSEASVERPESVLNLNRLFKMHWVLDSMEFGTAMVAYAIRRVYHWFPYQGSTFPITLDVRENPHPVFPSSWDNDVGRHAAPFVEEHFTIAKCWGILPVWREPFNVGHTVENRNRSYTPGTFVPLEQDRYGRPTVELWIRNVYPEGKRPDNWFGITDIRDNKQYPAPYGWRDSKFPATHKVEYTSITPYVTRKIWPASVDPSTQWGATTFPRVTIYPSAIAPITPPQPTVKAMSIYPRTVREATELDTRFGIPFIISPQWILGAHVKNPPGEDTTYGKPQVSHHTIWCRFDAPEQAKANHGMEGWELVDGWKWEYSQYPFGQVGPYTWVALKNRTIYASAGTLKPAIDMYGGAGWLEAFGMPMISLKRRWVYASGRSFMRMGLIDIPTTPRELFHYSDSADSVFGATRVVFPEEYEFEGVARPGGWKSHNFGTNSIELFNRTIGPPAAFTTDSRPGYYVDGLDGIQLGAVSSTTQPPPIYVTRVGPPILRQMTGIPPVQEPHAALVAYKIRHILPEGTDMLQTRSAMRYGMNSKMRVWKAL